MPVRAAVLFVLLTLCASPASACECANGIPIQKTFDRYIDRAVFTARVVQFMGQIHKWNGKLYSDRVLAVVHQGYWGLPWYWPKVVVLDGRYPCDIGMSEGEDYLVSGYRISYGVLGVNMCSRTRPLQSAQVDLRTLDGSHCAAPGGTIIGQVDQLDESKGEWSPVPNTVVTFRDWNGKAYPAQSDRLGVYELQHLPPGPYTLDSYLTRGRYVLSRGLVTSSICTDFPIHPIPYSVTGKLIPGISQYAHVDLVGLHGELLGLNRATIAPDGRFYFDSVPPGDYYLVATVDLLGRFNEQAKIYCPGVNSREKAVKVRVSAQTRDESFDFNPAALPLIPIPVIVEPPYGSHPIPVKIQTESVNGMKLYFWSLTGIPASVFGIRGESYSVKADGYGDERKDWPDRHSKVTKVTATPGMKTIALFFAAGESAP